MEQRSRTVETREAALHRLAALAKDRGIAVHTYDLAGQPEYYATSFTRPGTLHRTTLWSCDCAAFQRHQRCCHYAALLDHVGELPEIPADPMPTPPTAAVNPANTITVTIECLACDGEGTVERRDRTGDPWTVTCRECQGRGKQDITIATADYERYEKIDPTTILGTQCPGCFGEGFRKMSTGGRLSDWWACKCPTCQATGLVPMLARECDLVAA